MTLKEYRGWRRWSQERLAEELSKALKLASMPEVGQSHVSAWEKGTVPRREMRDFIAEFTSQRVKPASFLE